MQKVVRFRAWLSLRRKQNFQSTCGDAFEEGSARGKVFLTWRLHEIVCKATTIFRVPAFRPDAVACASYGEWGHSRHGDRLVERGRCRRPGHGRECGNELDPHHHSQCGW